MGLYVIFVGFKLFEKGLLLEVREVPDNTELLGENENETTGVCVRARLLRITVGLSLGVAVSTFEIVNEVLGAIVTVFHEVQIGF